MDNVDDTVQAFLRPHLPWTPADLDAMAQVQAQQRAEDQRRQDFALMDQQQHLQATGVL